MRKTSSATHQNTAVVTITADSIYRHSDAVIDVVAQHSFTLTLSGSILMLLLGRRSGDGTLRSSEHDGRQVVSVRAMDWLRERVVNPQDDNPEQTHNSYGMRYFPFVSSFVRGTIDIQGAELGSVVLDLPDQFRVIWDGVRVLDADGTRAILDHALGAVRSRWLFRWQNSSDDREHDRCTIEIPVRFGGAFMLKVTEYPLYYSAISMAAVALAAYANDIKIMLGALVAVYGFMLRHWHGSGLPQRGTLLTHCYLIGGVLLTAWAFVFRVSPAIGIGLALAFGYLFYKILSVLKQFSFSGELPSAAPRYWSRRVQKRVQAQKSAWKP